MVSFGNWIKNTWKRISYTESPKIVYTPPHTVIKRPAPPPPRPGNRGHMRSSISVEGKKLYFEFEDGEEVELRDMVYQLEAIQEFLHQSSLEEEFKKFVMYKRMKDG